MAFLNQDDMMTENQAFAVEKIIFLLGKKNMQSFGAGCFWQLLL